MGCSIRIQLAALGACLVTASCGVPESGERDKAIAGQAEPSAVEAVGLVYGRPKPSEEPAEEDGAGRPDASVAEDDVDAGLPELIPIGSGAFVPANTGPGLSCFLTGGHVVTNIGDLEENDIFITNQQRFSDAPSPEFTVLRAEKLDGLPATRENPLNGACADIGAMLVRTGAVAPPTLPVAFRPLMEEIPEELAMALLMIGYARPAEPWERYHGVATFDEAETCPGGQSGAHLTAAWDPAQAVILQLDSGGPVVNRDGIQAVLKGVGFAAGEDGPVPAATIASSVNMGGNGPRTRTLLRETCCSTEGLACSNSSHCCSGLECENGTCGEASALDVPPYDATDAGMD